MGRNRAAGIRVGLTQIFLQLLAKFVHAWHLVIGEGMDRPMAIGAEKCHLVQIGDFRAVMSRDGN